MFRNSLLVLALITATPALAGPSVTGEVRFADPRGSKHTDSTEYKVEFNDSFLDKINYGVELQTKQNEGAGSPTSKVSVKIGPALPKIYGFKPTAYAEFGHALNSGHNYNFWGAGAKVSHVIYGPVYIVAGYRHREGFTLANMRENRLNAGLNVEVSNDWTIGSQYYRTRGTTNSDAIALAITRNF